jgi:hypothetical protein
MGRTGLTERPATEHVLPTAIPTWRLPLWSSQQETQTASFSATVTHDSHRASHLIQNVPGSNLGPETGNPDGYSPWLSSVGPEPATLNQYGA